MELQEKNGQCTLMPWDSIAMQFQKFIWSLDPSCEFWGVITSHLSVNFWLGWLFVVLGRLVHFIDDCLDSKLLDSQRLAEEHYEWFDRRGGVRLSKRHWGIDLGEDGRVFRWELHDREPLRYWKLAASWCLEMGIISMLFPRNLSMCHNGESLSQPSIWKPQYTLPWLKLRVQKWPQIVVIFLYSNHQFWFHSFCGTGVS